MNPVTIASETSFGSLLSNPSWDFMVGHRLVQA